VIDNGSFGAVIGIVVLLILEW